MNFKEAVISCFKSYYRFSGRASRSEYWYFTLFMIIGNILTHILDNALLGIPYRSADIQPLNAIFSLATFLPSLAVDVRRMHDLNRSGWWLLLYFTIIGAIIPLLIWKCTKGTEGENRFGPDPLSSPTTLSEENTTSS